MKNLLRASALSLFIITSALGMGDGVVGTIEKAGKKLLVPVEVPQKLFPTSVEEKQAKLTELQKEKKQLQDSEQAFLTVAQKHSEEIKGQLDQVTEGLKHDPEDDFLNKKLSILNERYQIIKNLQLSREQLVAVIDENISLLQEYLQDPNLREYRKELNVSQRDIYSLEDLQQLSHLIIEKERTIAQLLEQEKNADTEIENRKRTAAVTAESYKKKRDEQASLGIAKGYEAFDLGLAQRAELLKLEEQLYADKNERDNVRLKEIENKKALIKTKVFIEKSQLEVLKEAVAKVKPAIKVNEVDVALARDDLSKKQQQSFARKEAYNHDIEAIILESKIKEQELQDVSAKYQIQLGADLDEWSRHARDTIQGYTALFDVASQNDALLVLQRKKELLEAQTALEDETLHLESTHVDIKNSFYKIATRKFISEEDTKQERKLYEERYAEVKASASLYKEHKSNAQERLDKQKKALVNIKEMRSRIYDKRNTIFRGHQEEYARCLDLLNSAEDKIQKQIDILTNILAIYTDILGLLSSIFKQMDFIIAELELTTIWQRSKYAITWEGVQNIVPDLEAFVASIKGYISTLQLNPLMQELVIKLQTVSTLAFLFFLLVVFILFILLCRWIAPQLVHMLIHVGKIHRGLRVVSFLLAMLIGFIGTYCAAIFLWIILVFVVHYYDLNDPYPYILLYLISIPYLLYLANRLINYFVQFNRQYDYVFLSKSFEWRFITVASTLAYATITIVFFREAFLLGGYTKSELPTILLAINFIIFQIALIFLIAKEWIISIIPTTGEFWRWVVLQVDRFYYLILMLAIAIIVMSNPYVGFGKLVLYILSRLIYTVILVRILLWLNSIFKRSLSYVFFSRSGEEYMRERFAYAKTLYGFFAVVLLAFFLIVTCILTAKIWGWPEAFAKVNQWSDIMAWLRTPIILENTDNPISLFSVFKIFSFIMVGFIIAFLVDHFVIEKIFDALLVEPGVQNTISSIVRYIVLIISIIFAFQAVGLGELVWILIGGLIVGVGWVIKEPVGDFIAYFIILVQRPVKIGDFIKMDEESYGVVRKITPRSVVVRKKNSTTIVFPNTMIINKPIFNWNYGRGFIAFEDIVITISYKEDPAKVKEVILKVLDENSFILKSPTPIVRLENFSDHGFMFIVRGFLSSNYTLDQWDIASDVRFAIVKKLRENAIQIAVPIRIAVDQDSATLEDAFGIKDKKISG